MKINKVVNVVDTKGGDRIITVEVSSWFGLVEETVDIYVTNMHGKYHAYWADCSSKLSNDQHMRISYLLDKRKVEKDGSE